MMSVDWQGDAYKQQVRQAVARGVSTWALKAEAESVRLIEETNKTGRIYRRRGVEHQASAPGEPPASDTGRLVNSRRVDLYPEELRARLTYSTEYAAFLQFGTINMEPRPFLDVAVRNTFDDGQAAIAAEVAAVSQ